MQAQHLRPAAGISAFRHPLGSRFVQFYALDAEGGSVLFDTGLPGMVMPWIDQGLIQPPTLAIISHADADHLGDTAALRRRFPSLRVACHAQDRAWIADHDLLVAARYDGARLPYDLGYSPDVLRELRAACGDSFVVDEALADGQQLSIGARTWEVLHTPGHSHGHIALWSAADGILLMGEALLGYGPPAPGQDLRPVMPPTHQFTEDYLATIERLLRLPVRLVLSAHWDFMDGAAFAGLARASRDCVERDLAVIRSACRQSPQTPAELLALLNQQAQQTRTWPPAEDIHYFYALSGYLEYLVARGEIHQEGRAYVMG